MHGFMHESFLKIEEPQIWVGVRSRMLRPEMQLVPAVTSLNVDGFVDMKLLCQYLALSSASRHCIQLKLSLVTLYLSLSCYQINITFVTTYQWPYLWILMRYLMPT